jgi:hypothetical protein
MLIFTLFVVIIRIFIMQNPFFCLNIFHKMQGPYMLRKDSKMLIHPIANRSGGL